MSAQSERDEVIHDMAGMVQVLDVGLLTLTKARGKAEMTEAIADCQEAVTRLRALFLRLARLYRLDVTPS